MFFAPLFAPLALLASLAGDGISAWCDPASGALEIGLSGVRLHIDGDAFALLPAQLAPSAPQVGEEGAFEAAPVGLVVGPGAAILAVPGEPPGLYRLLPGWHRAHRLAPGRVAGLCGTSDGDAWGLLVEGQEGDAVLQAALVRLNTRTPAVLSYPLSDALAAALPRSAEVPVAAVGTLLERARNQGWPGWEGLFLAASRDDRSQVRALVSGALVAVDTPGAVIALWLLAHDSAAEVRRTAFASVAADCVSSASVCHGMLSYFFTAPDADMAARARDGMLSYDPEWALGGAPQAYKLELLAHLAASLESDPRPHLRHALDLLSTDADLQVRDKARLLLDRLVP